MDIVIPVLLLILGLLFLVAEVFFPSLGILAFMATASVSAAVVMAFMNLSVGAGVAFVIAVLILVPLTLVMAFRILPRTPFGKRLILDGPSFGPSTGSATVLALEELEGKLGEAITTLRPSGTALIEGRRVDVVTRGMMIEKGTPIRVVKVEGNRVVVDQP